MGIKKFIKEKSGLNAYLSWQRIDIEGLKMLSAQSLIKNLKETSILHNFDEVEFSVFSQLGDDGIIQYLIHKLSIKNKVFIEFGVQNYIESNTRFLLMNNNWKGLVIDGSEKHIQFIKSDYYFWKYDLTAKCKFITSENINGLIEEAGIGGEIGLLHIDIDGNDYWIWKALEVVNPIIVIMEYNSGFGDERSITVPYVSDFERYKAHYSGVYFGASLPAMCDLASEKGYCFIGSNSYGNNAYFVKEAYLSDLKALTAKEGYRFSNCRQNKDINGKFTHVLDYEVLRSLKDLKVYNTRTQQLENLN